MFCFKCVVTGQNNKDRNTTNDDTLLKIQQSDKYVLRIQYNGLVKNYKNYHYDYNNAGGSDGQRDCVLNDKGSSQRNTWHVQLYQTGTKIFDTCTRNCLDPQRTCSQAHHLYPWYQEVHRSIRSVNSKQLNIFSTLQLFTDI